MSVQEFMAYRQGASFRMKVSMELVLHCAPILKDVKPANIVAVTPDRKSTRLNSSHSRKSRMPSSA